MLNSVKQAFLCNYLSKNVKNGASVLCFHNIGDEELYDIKLELLIHIIHRVHNRVISIDDVINDNNISGKYVITFDDGYRQPIEQVVPLMEQLRIPYVLYIATDNINVEGYVTCTELKNVSKSELCTIGSHMCSHNRTISMRRSEIRQEWVNSKRILEDIIEKEVVHAALPYGNFYSCSIKSMALAYKCGYKSLALTLPYRASGRLIPRYVYKNNQTDEMSDLNLY